MPAPNIATLYDFESAYEDAVQGYFANLNIGGQTFAQVVTPRSNLTEENFLVTPRLQVKVGMTALGASGSGLQENPVVSENVTTRYYSYYTLGLQLDVVTARSNVSQRHGLLRGAVRQGMLEITAILNANTVPYYQTAYVTPLSSVQGIDAQNDEIQTQLTYGLDVFIPPESWPDANTPSNLAASFVTDTHVRLTWDASSGSPGFYLANITSIEGSIPGWEVNASQLFMDINSLTPGIEYTFSIYAVDENEENPSPPSNEIVVTTATDPTPPPSVPDGLVVLSATDSSITFSWNASTGGVVGPELYGISVDGVHTDTVFAPATEYTLNGLMPATEYSLTVEAVDFAAQHFAFSAPLLATTAAGP
jgi:chitodextrinase